MELKEKKITRHQAKVPLLGRQTQVPKPSILGPLCPQGLPQASPPPAGNTRQLRQEGAWKGGGQASAVLMGLSFPHPTRGRGPHGQSGGWQVILGHGISLCIQDAWGLEWVEWCPAPQIHVHLESVHVDLFGKRVLQMSLGYGSRILVLLDYPSGPKSRNKCPYKRSRGRFETQKKAV